MVKRYSGKSESPAYNHARCAERIPNNNLEKIILYIAKDALGYRILILPYLLAAIIPASWSYFGTYGTLLGFVTGILIYIFGVRKSEKFTEKIIYVGVDTSITRLFMEFVSIGISLAIAAIVLFEMGVMLSELK